MAIRRIERRGASVGGIRELFYFPRRRALEDVFAATLRVVLAGAFFAGARLDFAEALRVFAGAFFAEARLDFVGARFVGPAFFDGAVLAPARFDRAAAALGRAVFPAAFVTGARLDFAGALLADALFVLVAFLAGFLAAAGRRRAPLPTWGDGPLAVAARTSAPPDAGAATGALAAAADAPSPSQNLISARSPPSALR
jgi:hypothetical protein